MEVEDLLSSLTSAKEALTITGTLATNHQYRELMAGRAPNLS
jgi:hypothetical protein